MTIKDYAPSKGQMAKAAEIIRNANAEIEALGLKMFYEYGFGNAYVLDRKKIADCKREHPELLADSSDLHEYEELTDASVIDVPVPWFTTTMLDVMRGFEAEEV